MCACACLSVRQQLIEGGKRAEGKKEHRSGEKSAERRSQHFKLEEARKGKVRSGKQPIRAKRALYQTADGGRSTGMASDG